MTNSEMWAIVVGFLMPLILAVWEQPNWSDPVRALWAAFWCILAGVITVYFNGGLALDQVHIATTILLVLLSAIGFYKGFWKPTGVAPNIENTTSPSQ